MTTFEEKTLNEIKARGIKPKNKFIFTLREASIWTSLYAAFFFVVISISVSIFLFLDTDWEALEDLDLRTHEKILQSIPYVWIILGASLLFLIYKLVLCTKSGYKKITWRVVLGAFAFLLISSFILHLSSIAEKIENNASSLPYYQSVVSSKKSLWQVPERGMLAGNVTDVVGGKKLQLKDLNKKDWDVEISSITQTNGIQIRPGIKIKIIGRKIADSIFEAIEIRKW